MPLVQLADGSTVIFLAPGASGDFEAQGLVSDKVATSLMQIAQRGGQVLLETVDGVRSALSSVAPTELEIELALSLSKEATLIVCSGKVEGSVKIKAVWKKANASNG